MKKSVWLLPLAVIAFASCKSTKVPLTEHSPMAIVTIYGNPSVAWYEEKVTTDYKVERQDEGFLTGLINKALLRDTSETDTAQERIDDAAKQITELLRSYGIVVIDPGVLRDTPAYKHAGKTFFDDIANTLPAEGYDAISSSTSQLNKRMMDATGAKSVAYIKFKFQKVKVQEGLHDIGVAARVHMEIFAADEKGKTLLNKEYDEVSKAFTDFYKNSWDRKAVCGYFHDTIHTLLMRFADDFLEVDGAISPATSDDSELTPVKLDVHKGGDETPTGGGDATNTNDVGGNALQADDATGITGNVTE